MSDVPTGIERTIHRFFVRIWLLRISLPRLDRCLPLPDGFGLKGFGKLCEQFLVFCAHDECFFKPLSKESSCGGRLVSDCASNTKVLLTESKGFLEVPATPVVVKYFVTVSWPHLLNRR